MYNEKGECIRKDILDVLPKFNTLVEKSRSGKGLHLWIVTDLEENITYPTIEIKANGMLAIATEKYIYGSLPIRTIKKEELLKIIKPFVDEQLPKGIDQNDPTPTHKNPLKIPKKIPEGIRNTELHKTACSLAAKGLDDNSVLSAIIQENNEKCSPPLPGKEVISIAKSATGFNKRNPFPDTTTIDSAIALKTLEIEQIEKEMIRKIANIYVDAAVFCYERGGFISYCESVFKKIWLGDLHIFDALMYVAASFRLENPDEGIHLGILGITQIGKSDSTKKGLKLIPLKDQITLTISPKWIFYADEKGELHENMILFSDDTSLEKEVAALFRNVLTSWDTGVRRGVVDNMHARTLGVPRHISLVLTSVDSITEVSNQGQDESRFLLLEVTRTPTQEDAVWEFVQKEKENVGDSLLLAHLMWSVIPHRKIKVHKILPKHGTIREGKRFLTLIKCHALLCNRDTTTDEDVDAIEKFLTYSKPMIDNITPAHKRDEKAMLCVLTKEFQSTDDLQTLANIPIQRVYRALRGSGSFDRPDGGLMGSVKNLKMEYNPDTRKHSFKI